MKKMQYLSIGKLRNCAECITSLAHVFVCPCGHTSMIYEEPIVLEHQCCNCGRTSVSSNKKDMWTPGRITGNKLKDYLIFRAFALFCRKIYLTLEDTK